MKKHILIFWILSSCIVYSSLAQVNYQWAKGVGTTNGDIGSSTAVDDTGNVYIAGLLGNGTADFNPFGGGAFSVTSEQTFDCFFAKYDSTGNCKWAKSFEPMSGASVAGVSIAISSLGDIYISGVFTGTVDFDASSSGSTNLTSIGGADVFLVKYTNDGAFQWVKQLGGNSDEAATGLAINGTDTVYLAGYYESAMADFMDSSGSPEGDITNYGGKDGFLVGYSSAGTFLWAKSIGGMEDDVVNAIDANGSWVVVTGYFKDSIILGGGVDTLVAVSSQDAFFAKFTLDGYPAWAYSIRGQTGSIAAGTGVVMDANNINITGLFKGTIDFPDPANLSQVAATETATGKQDIFFAKYPISHSFDFVKIIGGSDNLVDSIVSADIELDQSGDIYLTGAFWGTIDFDPGGITNTYSSMAVNTSDVFFAKYEPTGEYDWVRRLGQVADDKGLGIAVDDAENVYITGAFQDTVDFDPGDGLANRESKGSNDIFIAKYSQGTAIISGTVYYMGAPVYAGNGNYVRLYTQISNDGNSAMHMMEQAEIIGSVYTFSDVPNGDYILLAVANNTDYPGSAPTYYGDSINWQVASHIIIAQSNTTYQADINLKTALFNFNGTATLSGTVREGEGFDRTSGTPISGTSVGIEHDPEGIIAHTETNNQGYYQFANVPAKNYSIVVYIPGLQMDASYDVSVDSADVLIDSLDFVADSSSIDTVSRVQTSIYSRTFQETRVDAYPNPYKGTTAIEFTLLQKEMVKLEVYNVIGDKVAELINEQKPAGLVKYSFNAVDKGLKAGIYILNLKIGNNFTSKRIIQIE